MKTPELAQALFDEAVSEKAARVLQAREWQRARIDEARRQMRASRPEQAGDVIERFLAERQAEAEVSAPADEPPAPPRETEASEHYASPALSEEEANVLALELLQAFDGRPLPVVRQVLQRAEFWLGAVSTLRCGPATEFARAVEGWTRAAGKEATLQGGCMRFYNSFPVSPASQFDTSPINQSK